jgi:glucose-1-phosphate cytidylyltransferase
MKIFILCGGFGTRLDYEGKLKAKPMVKIGNKPILIYIIENFILQGFTEFVFCLGYKSETITNYFLKDKKKYTKILNKKKNILKFEFNDKKNRFIGNLVYTGLNSGTGGRIKTAYKSLKLDEDFIMTYGDGLSNVNIKKLIKFHYRNKSHVTLTAVKPKHRYGILKLKNNKIQRFDNENKNINVFINGGFFVIDKLAISKIKSDSVYWEKEPLAYFIKKKKLIAFKHRGFWKSLDTMKDKNDFNDMIKKNKKPWIVKKS